MKKHIVFFEAEGGSDKGPDGYRADTMPMVKSLEKRGWSAEVIFYKPEERAALLEQVSQSARAYVPRVNPGNLPDEGEFHDFLNELSKRGVRGLPEPKVMTSYGAKDSLVKLKGLGVVPDDIESYYDMETFTKAFPKQLTLGERVLKQNRGSTGEGIWRVRWEDAVEGKIPGPDAKLHCVEAVDNHVEKRTLEDFMNFCQQYLEGEGGMLVDMPFFPRIKEGEIRLLMLYDTPINVVHKKPAEGADAFSATLFSGAKYRYDKPEVWQDLIDLFMGQLPTIAGRLGGEELPLIWTADFILDNDEQGKDQYVIGELNASCVGFTSQLELSEEVAETIIRILS
ncbi:Cj0069 family protein [Magnetococcales bacterium HHB-1]